jgi:putative flippase GtrA
VTPPEGDSARSIRPRQLLVFGAVGMLAFLVDAGVLHLAIRAGFGLHLGRLLSYLCAVTVSWDFNRRFTFSQSATPATLSNWLRFAVSQLSGAAVNLGCYFLLIHVSRTVQHFPAIGVAAGSVAGMALNFSVAKSYVFRGAGRSGALS